MLDLTIDHDKVVLEGCVYPRPSRLSPSAWLEFWNRENDPKDDRIEDLEDELASANNALEIRERFVHDIQEALDCAKDWDALIDAAREAHAAELRLAEIEGKDD